MPDPTPQEMLLTAIADAIDGAECSCGLYDNNFPGTCPDCAAPKVAEAVAERVEELVLDHEWAAVNARDETARQFRRAQGRALSDLLLSELRPSPEGSER